MRRLFIGNFHKTSRVVRIMERKSWHYRVSMIIICRHAYMLIAVRNELLVFQLSNV